MIEMIGNKRFLFVLSDKYKNSSTSACGSKLPIKNILRALSEEPTSVSRLYRFLASGVP